MHHHTVLYVSARNQNPSTNTSPYCTLRICPGSQSFYNYITILYLTSLPRVTIILQVHHDTVFYVSAWSHNHCASTSPYCTLRLCPGPQSFCKYITILYFTSLPGITIPLQVHHHTVLYISPGFSIFQQVHHHTVRYVSARGHNPSTSTTPYSTIRLYPGSQCFYKFITKLYFTSVTGVTILLQVNHRSAFYVSARGHNPSTSISPYCICVSARGSRSLYKYITILYFTSLPRVTNLLQVHHHAVRYVSARVHNHSTSTSPYCTLCICPGSQSFYKYITILYVASLPGVTILLQVHHHTVLYVSARGHNPSKATSPYFSIRLCSGSQSLYKYITILYFSSLPGVTISLKVHHHTLLYVSARGHNPSTSTSPYCTLRLCQESQSLYKYIATLYLTSLSTSPYC